MTEIVPKDSPKDESINAAQAMAIVESIGQAISQSAASQAESQKINAEANVRIAELQHTNERLHTHYGFVLRVFGGLAITGVIVGGFTTGHLELVTHALAGVSGLFAGYGLARATR